MAIQTPFSESETSHKAANPLVATYTTERDDTFSAIADRGLDLNNILTSNPGIAPDKLPSGQVVDVAPEPSGLVLNSNDEAPVLDVSAQNHQSTNSRVSTDTSMNEILKAPKPFSPRRGGSRIPSSTRGEPGGGPYVQYSGPASKFPPPSKWASYTSLWVSNYHLMKRYNSKAEIAMVKSAIGIVARETGVDVRVILCVIMQESGGNVRARLTTAPDGSALQNLGYMQSHNGVGFDESDPAGSILQMTRDGVAGTSTGDGLKQCFQHRGNWYSALREYNSGDVNESDLGDGLKATGSYVSDVANRLMGHTWDSM